MTEDLTDSLLYEHFGTTSPCWRLTADSNALQLSATEGPTSMAIALTSAQAKEIRNFTGITRHLAVDVAIYGQPQRLNLIGKRSDSITWTGTASHYADTPSVARDLAHGLMFAEQVVSEVNSLVVVIDHNSNIQRFNRLCEEVTGLREEDVVGKNAHLLFMPADEQQASRANINSFFSTAVSYEVERTINLVNGPRKILWRNKFVQSGSGPDERYLVCSGTDVTEERLAQAKLLELANKDTLTGLPNRHSIHEQIKTALADNKKFGVIFLDLDNFKKVNDHYGHVTGDRLIQGVALAIKSCLRDEDVAARLGGDEFLVMVEDATVKSMEAVAQRILDRMKVPFNLGLVEVYTGCSIGIAMSPEHGGSLEELVRSADTAMYVAKDAGKRTFRVFAPEMNNRVAEYMWLDNNLRKAVDEGQLVLHYQPKLCLKTGAVHGVEALVRWNSPERGRIPPLDFIPYAEESGVIVALGRWVLQTAAAQAMSWKAKGIDIRVAVNLSARQLCDSSVMEDFSESMRRAGMDACQLDLELTESCLIDDEVLAHSLIKQFRDLGAQVHLDDFGTGYSSLSQLARLPLDVIKLDRSFVGSININPKSQALVRSMVAVAQELEFRVVAEGVETEAEAEFLKSIGVDYAQGYLYAKPMTAPEFESWLNNDRKLRLVA